MGALKIEKLRSERNQKFEKLATLRSLKFDQTETIAQRLIKVLENDICDLENKIDEFAKD